MSAVGRLSDGSRTPGLYRVLEDVSTVAETLSAAGWRVAVVPAADGGTAFFGGLARAAGFGPSFGGNLDALWDSLNDLTEPTALVLTEWTRFARARPERWAAVLGVLQERCEVGPAFAVVLLD
ncbi:MAG: hypothetical protein JWP61_2529 [Friedmanniella sp.]|nr:hypothetical protein [Friedmanniella sp.]